MAEIDCQVLIIGAGPTGLMAANLLRRSGIGVRLVDKRAAAAGESRAGVMSARTLELFASLGLSDKLFENGVINSHIDFFVSGHRIGGLDYERINCADTPFPFILTIPQARTEAILTEALATLGVEVDRQIEVTGLEQDEGEVRLQATRYGSESITLRADYVIGADGAHSVVRRALNLPFEGAPYPQDFLMGDVRVAWAEDHERFRIFINGERIGLFLPLRGSSLARVMTTSVGGPPEEAPDDSALTLEALQSAFAEVSRLPVTLSNPQWLTRFRTHHRIVDRYRDRRVFVAGDAGHIHSPAGGQGMNTGLQDAANLSWKLAAVIHCAAPDALLDSYQSERLPVARDVLKFTDNIYHLAAGQTGWRARLRDMLAPVVVGNASNINFIHDNAFRKFSQMDIVYPTGPFIAEVARETPLAAPRAGERAPNAQLSRHRDLFDLLSGYCFHVIALSRRRLDDDEIANATGRLTALFGEGVTTHLVARLAVGHSEGVEPVERGEVFERYGLRNSDAQALLVVRPDGFLAWRAESLDFAGCRQFLALFGLAGTPSPQIHL